MVQIPPTYPPIQDPAIASFPAAELASGIGIVEFYGIMGNDPSGAIIGLIENTVGCEPSETSVVSTTIAYTLETPEFNLPRFVKGTAFVAANIAKTGGDASYTAKLQHWDGSTATDLTGTASSDVITVGTGTPYVQLPITTEKMVKKGETLRLIFTFTASGGSAKWGHCPDNRAGDANTQGTRLTVGIPFRSGA